MFLLFFITNFFVKILYVKTIKLTYYKIDYYSKNFFIIPTPTLMAFTGFTNAHGPSPHPTACRSPTCSLTTATGSNPA